MEKDELIQILRECLTKVHTEHWYLLNVNVDERSINHRFAMYLGKYFEKEPFHVDTEYNRHLNEKKEYEDNKYGSIDIIIHERDSENNFCAIECKKRISSKRDVVKIKALLGAKFRYHFGMTVIYFKRQIDLYWVENDELKTERINY